jgi:hypothetical protein
VTFTSYRLARCISGGTVRNYGGGGVDFLLVRASLATTAAGWHEIDVNFFSGS